mgnify:CR=1 FL=1|jgi:hypothetical protein
MTDKEFNQIKHNKYIYRKLINILLKVLILDSMLDIKNIDYAGCINSRLLQEF